MKRQLTSLGNGLLTRSNIKRCLSSLGGGLLLVAAFGATACDETGEPEQQDNAGMDNELGVNFDALGVNVPTCTGAITTGNTPVFVLGTKTLNLTLPANADAVISVVGGKLKVNGYQCKTVAVNADPSASPPVVASPSVELTSTNVNKLNIAADSTNKVVLDLLPGVFGNIFGAQGGVIITGTGMNVGVRGSAAANIVKMGQESTTALYLELSGDTKPDLKIDGDPNAVTLALGDGADSFSAQGQVMVTTSLGGSASTGDITVQPLIVYGGVGNDTLKGGIGSDTLDGGDGNDLFQTSAGSVDDGADVYIGGAGTDTADYSGRTDAVAVSVAPTYANGWAEGVNIFAYTAANASTILYTAGTVTGTVTFSADRSTPSTIVSEINADSTFAPLGTASINDRGELVIVKDGAVGALDITGGTAGLFGGTTRANDGVAQLGSDPDDGFQGVAAEGDDVRGDVENLTGGSGNDTLTGGRGHDTINGGAGDDNISGGAAGATCADDVDVLNGNDGDDVFAMGFATNCGDVADGGGGVDVADYQMRTAALTILVDALSNDGESSEADRVLATTEVVLGGSLGDVLTGGIGNDELHGGPGNDTISGGLGNDSIVGGPGLDTLLGGAGEDYFNETDATDQYKNSAGTGVNAFIKGHLGSTIGTPEADLINGGADFDTCDYGRTTGTAMTVTLCLAASIQNASGACAGATDTADTDDLTNCDDFVAGAGNDIITGSDGDDMINGGAGNDSIVGGAGNDQLIGGLGTDTVNGGAGEDICSASAVVTTCEI